jgi:peptide/nickel transport system substrate-binding protein/oligopeptide transport system substrate-binding protein
MAVLCLLTLLIAACGGGTDSSSNSGKAKDQIYVVPRIGAADIKTLDPAITTDSESSPIIQQMFTGLVEFDNNLNIKDELAQSHQLESDGLTWTFKLKPNLKFSNGDPLTSKDVAWSINRALDPKTKSTTAGTYLALIKGADEMVNGKRSTLIGYSLLTPDDNTIKIVTTQKASYFLQTLTYPTSYVLNKKILDKYGDRWAEHIGEGAGSGPFTLSKWNHGVELQVVPNDNYYGKKPQLKKVVYAFYKTTETAWKAYEGNQLMAANVPAAQTEHAKQLPKNQYWSVPELSVSYVTMNYLVKPFDNVKVRQAFALSINREQLSHNISKDRNIPSYHIVPDGQPGYNKDLTGPAGVKNINGDPALAKKLLEEGLKEEGMTADSVGPLRLTVSAASAASMQTYQALQQMWEKTLGVKVQIDNVDWTKFLDVTTNSTNNPKGLQMWVGAWIADYPDPQDWLTLQFDKTAQNNWNYGMTKEQQEVQALMRKADQETDQTKRMQMYNQAEQALVNDAAWIPISQGKGDGVMKPCVKNMPHNSMRQVDPEAWADIYISTDSPCANVSKYA